MPPSASWNLPRRFSTAPVNEPFSWPNRMLSTRFSGSRAAVDGDERLGLALALALDGAGDQLLADAALALDQHGDVGGGRAAPERDHALHGVAADDQVGEGERAFGALLDAGDLALQRLDLEGALDRDLETLGRGRLDDEVDRTGAHGVDGGIDRAVRRLHDDGGRAGLGGEALQHLHAVAAGHDHVEEDERDCALVRPLEDLYGLFAALGGLGLVAETLDGFFEDAALCGIVVDDQDKLGHRAGTLLNWLQTRRSRRGGPRLNKRPRTLTGPNAEWRISVNASFRFGLR